MNITQEELNTILEKHKKYLCSEDGGERADLSNADLSRANLSHANLRGANLRGANLIFASLVFADLSNADLSNADLSFTNLYLANLDNSNLRGAILDNANFECSHLEKAKLDEKDQYRLGFIVEEPLTGYKKLRNHVIATLEIPTGTTVFCINGINYRTNKAKCIALSKGKVGRSCFDKKFKYKVGKALEIEDFDTRYNEDRTSGIHFFKTIEEAKKY